MSLCRALEKQNGYSTSPSRPKLDAESDQQDLKVLLQNRAGAQHAGGSGDRLLPINTNLYTCTHTNMHTCKHTHTHICAHTHTHPYAHLTHTRTHTCIHTRTRTHTAHNYFKTNMNLHQKAPLQGFPALWNQETCSKNTQFHE